MAAAEPGNKESGKSTALTGMEQLVADVWREVLNLKNSSTLTGDSNFFYLGGDSLNAIRVVLRLSELFRANIPVRAVFTHSTISALADHLEHYQTSDQLEPGKHARIEVDAPLGALDDSQMLVKLRSGGPEWPTLFLVHPAGGSVICFYSLARYLRANVYAIRYIGTDYPDLLSMAEDYARAVRESGAPRGSPWVARGSPRVARGAGHAS